MYAFSFLVVRVGDERVAKYRGCRGDGVALQHTSSRCNSLQLTAIHCNALHNDTHVTWDVWGVKEERYIEAAKELQSHCNTHQLAATHCNSL